MDSLVVALAQRDSRTSLRALPAAALAGAAVLFLAAPAASADSVSLKIETESAGQATYFGKVKTKRDECAKKRTVQVFDLTQSGEAGGFFIGQATTDDKGRYELTEFVPSPGSQVRVAVPKKKKAHGSCPGVEKKATVPDDPGVP